MFHIDPLVVLDADPIEWHIRLAAATVINNDRKAQADQSKPSILDSSMPDYG